MRVEVTLPPASYVPHNGRGTGGQRALHASGARFLSLSCGTRGGKTKGAGVEFAVRIFRDAKRPGKRREVIHQGKDRRPALHYWVVAPTVALLREPKRCILDAIPAELIARPGSPINAEGQLWLVGDILIEFKSADNPLSLVSVGLDGMWIDEAARIKREAWSGNLRGRLTDHEGWCLFTSTPLGRNWFYTEVVAPGLQHAPQFDAISWRTADNPHIPLDEIESARRQLSDRYFKREYEASFDAFNGLVYEEWDDAIHLVSERPPPSAFRSFHVGLDVGWNSPGAAVLLGDMGNGWAMVLDEFYRSNLIFHDPSLKAGTWTVELRKMLAPWGGRAQINYDPSAAYQGHDLRRAGFFALPADNEIESGIRGVSAAFHPIDMPQGKTARLRVWKGCTNLLRERASYVWGVSRTGELTEYPAEGQSDHALDALRYGHRPIVEWMKAAA